MNRPAPRQWVVLWVGAICVLFTLALAEEYVVRGILAALIVTGLLYWQLSPLSPRQPKSGPVEGTEPEVSVAPTAEPKPEPTGVGGWLAVLIVVIGIGMPVRTVIEIFSIASTSDDAWGFGGALLAMVVVATSGAYIGWALWRRWPDAPKTASRFIVGYVVLSALDTSVSINAGADTSEVVGRIIGSSIFLSVWTSYLRKSRRVKNTFVPNADLDSPNRNVARIGAAALAALLIWLGSTLYSSAQTRFAQQYAEINPYHFIRAARQIEANFIEAFASSAIKALAAKIPQSTLTLAGPASFDDLGSALRVVVRYKGELDTDTGKVAAFDGKQLFYYHADGVAVIESACFIELLECSGMQQLISTAEEALLSKLNSSQLGGILPDGKCASESVPLLSQQRSASIMVCQYTDSEAASLTLARSTLDETRTAMQSSISALVTPAFKRKFVKQVTALQ